MKRCISFTACFLHVPRPVKKLNKNKQNRKIFDSYYLTVLRINFSYLLYRLKHSDGVYLQVLTLSALIFLLHDLQADWILELVSQNSTIIGVVGWVDLTDPKVTVHLRILIDHNLIH